MLAAIHGRLEVVKLLLEHQASINATDNNGWDAINLALKYGHTEIYTVLQETSKLKIKESGCFVS